MRTQTSPPRTGRPGTSIEVWNQAVELLSAPGARAREVAEELGIGLTKIYEIKRNPNMKTAPTADTAEA